MDKVLNVMSLLLVGVGIVLTVTFFVEAPFLEGERAAATEKRQPASPAIGVKAGEGTGGISPRARAGDGGAGAGEGARKERRKPAYKPDKKMLRVTIPGMARVREATIPYAAGDNEDAFREHAGVHLRGTGDPWDKEANVYIAGHRLGYPNTDSWLAFWDLNKLESGDRVFVTDANGKRYVYKVFEQFVVGPRDVYVTEPIEGKNVLSLQTCTLPDYSRRLIVRAERVA